MSVPTSESYFHRIFGLPLSLSLTGCNSMLHCVFALSMDLVSPSLELDYPY
jgi:hypothetical protein